MSANISPPWLQHFIDSPILSDVVHVECLRRWSLSEVLRLTLKDGRTFIAKKARPLNRPSELEIYQQLLIPLSIDVPIIYSSHYIESESLMLMEDLKGANLEQQPKTSYYLEAVRQLARIRESATKGIKAGKICLSVYQRHYVSQQHFIDDLNYLLENMDTKRVDDLQTLREVARLLPLHLDRLYREYPITLTHNDYHSKNLIISSNSLVAIDWANAYLSPHLGDLYCILQEAIEHNISPVNLIETYRFETSPENGMNDEFFEWHLNMGGLCWSIHSLRWILEFGIDVIPSSESWVPNIISDIRVLVPLL